MSMPPPTAASAPPPPPPPPPSGSAGQGPPRRAWRDLREPVLGGVAAGVAAHLSVPVVAVRAVFAATTLLNGAGLAAYAALWVLLPAGPPPEVLAPGLESAQRAGLRPGRTRRLADVGPAIALALLAIGALIATGQVLGTGWWVWPLGIALAGVALLWRQADEAQRARWLDATGRLDAVRVVIGDGGWASWARLGAGVVLVVVALLVVVLRGGSGSVAWDSTLAVVLAVGGVAVVLSPFVLGLVGELGREREERVRTQERADVAAHLHDSVLQTLALIQKSPGDAVRLARAQERDLRAWLYAGEALDDATVASALRAAAGEVEDAYGLVVDVVTVGDRPSDEHTRALVMAAREAATNAAKHAGVVRVDVYAEIGDARAEVFVRDRGRGFDPAATPDDRLGVRGSIIGRMERHGGTAVIRSAPGEGTEVRLLLDRGAVEEGES